MSWGILYLIWAALAIAGGIWLALPVMVIELLLGVPLILLLVQMALSKLSVRHRLTTLRLFTTSGLLVRETNELELIRVDDLSVSQNLFELACNIGTITIFAPTDVTSPKLVLRGISNPHAIKEIIREQVRRAREKSIRLDQI